METTQETMRAAGQHELGGPDVLKVVTVPRPTPGIGEILIRVHAAGVNPVDAMTRQFGMFVGQPPFVLGWDVSGVVAAVGPGVTVHRDGEEVFGMLPFPGGHGAYADYAVGPARAFVPKPANLSHVQAAALLTAYQIGAGDRVLINGGAGGVGHLAVQIARAHGAHVLALASPADAACVCASAPTR
jgi:NADPH:quinone reductase-like Zn-dependent oxidoreductase